MNKNNNKNGSRVLQGLLLATTAITGSSVIAATAAMASGPTGGAVVVGHATITNPSATQTTITQSSKKALINWNSFSISQGSTVTFNQPNSKSLTVNRVTGPNASAIDGQLLANGSVWLINANGILFGKGSEINVGALIATTSDISNDDFKNGNYDFSKPSSNPNASVTNLGTITTSSGGSVVLSAPSVSNQGLIQANLGTVVLGGASAFTVDMTGDNLLRYQISAPVAQAPADANGNPQSALVSNAGTIVANGGQVVMTARAAQSVQDDVINNTGMVQATSVSSHNGEIDLDVGTNGAVNVGGTLDASGAAGGQTGGTVTITGQNVNVSDGAKVNASGDMGGGTIEIGGGLHGQGAIANAQNTTVGNATITADAITKGNGGTISVWSTGNTSFNGSISARGGSQGGNGGQVETSGQNLSVGDNATVDTTAPLGLTGDWLLDPDNITITSGSSAGTGCTAANCTISPTDIKTSLGTTNVTLQANDDIQVLSSINYNSNNTLSLVSEGTIEVDAQIANSANGAINVVAVGNIQIENIVDSKGGNVAVVASWNGTDTNLQDIGTTGFLGSGTGAVTIGGSSGASVLFVGSGSGSTSIYGYNVDVDAEQGNAQIGYGSDTFGNIKVYATNEVSVKSGGDDTTAQIGNGGNNAFGAVGGNISIQSGGDILLEADGTGSNAIVGNVSESNTGSPTGNTGSQGGNITIVAGDPEAVHGLELHASGDGSNASIGNFALGTTAGDAGDVSGTINVTAYNGIEMLADSEDGGASAVIGNGSIYNTTTEGAITVNTDGIFLDANSDNSLVRVGDTADGNVNFGAGGTDTITINATNDNYSGEVYAIAGGQSSTAVIGADSQSGDIAGDINIAADGDINVEAGGESSQARVGNSGINVNSNITVTAGSQIEIATDADADNSNATIGNFSNSGTVGGDIDVTSSTNIDLSALGEDSSAVIGNAGSPDQVSGSVTLIAQEMSGLGQSIENDVPNGDMTLEQIGNGEITLDGDAEYASDHDLTVLAQGNIEVTGTLLNTDGTGAITLVAGWDGHTFDIADLTDPAKNAYGNTIPGGDARGSVIVGGVNADGDAEVGDAGGALTVEGYDVDVQAYYGNAQIGYSGGNSSAPGTITVNSINDVNVTADRSGLDDYDYYDSYYAQIGNGGDNTSDNGGDVTVNAGHDVNVIGNQYDDAGYDSFDIGEGYAQIGNGGDNSSNNSGTVAVNAGNDVNVTAGVGDVWYAQIGNGGDSSSDSTGAVSVTAGGNLNVTGEGDFAQIGNGGWGSSGDAGGDVTVNVTGDLTLSAPNDPDDYYDSSDVYGYAQIGNGGENASDSASGTIMVTAGNVELDGGFASNLYAQIGNGAADGTNEGNASGDISVIATGTINAYDGDGGLAWIGNNADTSNDYTESGNVTLIGSDVSLDNDNLAFDLGNGDVNDNGGDVFVGYTNGSGSSYAATFDGVTYDSGNSLTLAATGDLTIEGDVQNSGAGDITLVGGWDGSTTNVPTIIANEDNEYGNNNATVTIGGATDPAVGSKNGTTTIVSDNLTVDASNENAQVGYNDGANSAGGDIDIALTGSLSLIGDTSDDDEHHTAQIGNGDYGSNPGGDVTITAASISNTANSDVTGDNVTIDITGSGNAIGTSGQYLDVAVNNLAITTQGGDAYINSPNQGFNIGVESVGGVELNGGDLYLSATGGDITQSASIDASSINVTTVSSGDITLTNGSNTFGFATISSAGSATIDDSVSLQIDSAYVSDTLTLDVDGDITQGSGAISATTLVATATATSGPATSGSITLDNSGNTISFATLSASGDATLDDSSALEIDGATVGSGNTLTLYDTASGGITQGGTADDPIMATNLVATATSGPITLGNTSNSVSNATLSASGNVALYDTAALTIQKATLAGYTLTLTDTNAGGIGQASGASYGITAGAIDATATSGAIVLDSAYNNIEHATLSAAMDATLDDASPVEIDGASVGSGHTLMLYDTGNGGITQGSGAGNAIVATNLIATTTAGSNAGNIILDNTSNTVGTATFTATGNVTLDDSIALTLNSASLAGQVLTLNDSGGIITQGSGAITAGSVNATTTASSAPITLTNTGNSFGALTLSAAGDGSIYDTAALTIDGASVGNTLTITDTNSGGIHQGAGSANKITASNLIVKDVNGAITLNNMSNAIGTLVLTANGSSTVDDSVALKILGATVGASNALTLYETNGNITQGAATTNAINANALNVTDTSGAVILDNANNVVGTLALSATGDSTFDDASALVLNGITVTGGHGFTLKDTGGNITQTAAIIAGSLNANATSGGITLTYAGNAVGAASFAATSDVSFADSVGFRLDGASLAGHVLTLTDTGGSISQGSAPSNAIVASTLIATTTGSSAGAITLMNTSNAVGTATFVATGDVSLYDIAALTLNGASLAGHTLTLTDTNAGGIVEGPGGSNAITAASLVATDNNGGLTFANASNAVGAVTFSAGGDVTFDDSTGFEVDGASLAGYTLTLDPAEAAPITQGSGSSDAIVASAIIATNPSGSITLGNTYNSVGAATFSAGGDVLFYDTAALTLNGASLAGHALTLIDTAAGGIGQGSGSTNAIVASALSATDSNGDITLTNTSNTVDNASFTAGGDADFYDTSALEIDGASVDGKLTLTVASGDITQGSGGSSGILAGTVNATATSGAVTLDNDNNSIGAVTFSASTDATLHDASDVEIDGVSVGDANTFTVVDTGGNVTQGSGSGNAITAPTLSASATNGSVNLNNASNAVATASLSSSGNSTLYDSQDLSITGISVGGNLTLLTTGNLTFESSAQLSSGDLLAVAGWDGTTTSRTSIIGNGAYGNNSGSITIGGDNADSDVAVGSASGTTTLAGDTVTLDAENGYAQLGYHGAGGGDIYAYAKGDIIVQATDGSNYALIGNGTLGEDVSGNETGNIYLLATGDIQLNTNGDSDEPATPWIGNSFGSSGVASGNLTIVAQDEEENCGTGDCDYGIGMMVLAALGSTTIPGSGGDVVVAYTNPENNDSPVMTITDSFNYNSPHNLTVVSGNSLYVDNSLQNAGSGNITLISGWNSGAVTGQNIIGAVQNNTAVSSLFSSKSSYGQTNNSDPNAGSIEIGCDAGDATCSSNTAAVGSASGTVTVFTNNLELTAGAGLGAQLGYVGAGSGAINVNAQGNVALTGGSVTGSYAQIGDGGYKATGNTSDNITVNAGGIVQLQGGTAQETYAQVGSGGAESNSNSTGYSDTGFVTVNGQSVVLQGGTGSAAYTQIGNGGYRSGEGLNGTATVGGAINVTVSPPSNTAGVALAGGGADSYAQIGNGGDQVNYLWSGTGGTISGDISVKVSPAQSNSDAIQMVGGTGNNAYAQVGNGGNGENTPASGTAVGFTVSGVITVADLKLWGGNGTNDYGQIGNGDNAGTGYGNVGGNIFIGGTDFNLKNGNGSGDGAGIGNNTGFGTITNNILGYPPSNTGPGAGAQGAISSTTQIPTIPTGFDITTVTITPGPGSSPSNDNGSGGTTPLEQIADGNGEGSQDSDSAADALGNSLNGHKVSSVTHIIIPGVLTQIVTLGSHNPNGVPPADADYSSWGNEALWRW